MARTDQPDLETTLLEAEAEDDLGVVDFLEMFALSLTEGATEAIAQMWETPALVISDEDVRAIGEREELLELFAGAREHYNSAGVTDTRPEVIRLDEITDKVVMVRVRWPWLDDEGNELGAECSTYTLRQSAAGDWKIRCVVMHGAEALN
ncbi:MAG TPA: hypothetical protein VEA80_06205 [Vitreimonas sp.]|uniref:hypothetical protein n=1 Tax=Vitreimonas sp. TaxID=3069702 RepID=UPI002D70D33F|nr:hypothetical protein [Vitreimonas sp.]HYD87046.1 hypothetical protein [Vitreimonas sp.]